MFKPNILHKCLKIDFSGFIFEVKACVADYSNCQHSEPCDLKNLATVLVLAQIFLLYTGMHHSIDQSVNQSCVHAGIHDSMVVHK